MSFPEFIRTVEVAELYADERVTEEECRRACKIVDDYYMSATPENDYRNCADLAVVWASDPRFGHDGNQTERARHGADCARGAMQYSPEYRARLAAGPPDPEPQSRPKEAFAAFLEALEIRTTFEEEERCRLDHEEEVRQVGFLRDIFGNPFCPVLFSPEWRTGTALSLARQMYESRDFGAMPILADALQDAGCEDEEVLAHCRGESCHVHGCWVLDAVLGRG